MAEGYPKLIHFIWIGPTPGEPAPPMPDWAERNIQEFRDLNPEYEVRIHGEEVMLPEYAETYARAAHICTRADVLVFSALQRYGGWYFDTDYWPFRSIETIIESHGLDGQRMFVTDHRSRKTAPITIANGIMAVRTDWAGWKLVRDATIGGEKVEKERCALGPILLTRLVGQRPAFFTVGSWPWFYPAEIGRAVRVYNTCIKRGGPFARHLAPTAGQVPFTLHLWAGGATELKASKDPDLLATLPGDEAGPWHGDQAAVVVLESQWIGRKGMAWTFPAVAEGLARIGFDVEVRRVDAEHQMETADIAVVWNGRRGHYRARAGEARTMGLPLLQIEHGFFDRHAYVQIDHAGILHWASWADGDLRDPAPADGAARLSRVWPKELRSFAKRREGYVLILGQLAGDSQMMDSEVNALPALEIAVKRALPPGVPGRVRPHPSQTGRERHVLFPRCEAASLEEAIAGASFAVTINSNAGNEALALGCPVLALGPSIYGRAGVARETTLAGLKPALAEMLKGWRPKTEAVRNYLEWLACRQWNEQELQEGEALDGLIRRAMGAAA